MKRVLLILLLSIATQQVFYAQFSENKERKKIWKKSKKRRKNREAYNPYLDKKVKPSQELGKENARGKKRMEREAKKQKKKNKKDLGKGSRGFFRKKR